ncbi:MAG: hypothetical protein J0M11_01340 [Anaerolineae bacterium]|nr:hypothetical protein [Anaerolineae bacterium]
MYIRQNTPVFMLGWFFVAVGILLMFTREERSEVTTVLTDALKALDAQRGTVALDLQSAVEKEKAYVAE